MKKQKTLSNQLYLVSSILLFLLAIVSIVRMELNQTAIAGDPPKEPWVDGRVYRLETKEGQSIPLYISTQGSECGVNEGEIKVSDTSIDRCDSKGKPYYLLEEVKEGQNTFQLQVPSMSEYMCDSWVAVESRNTSNVIARGKCTGDYSNEATYDNQGKNTSLWWKLKLIEIANDDGSGSDSDSSGIKPLEQPDYAGFGTNEGESNKSPEPDGSSQGSGNSPDSMPESGGVIYTDTFESGTLINITVPPDSNGQCIQQPDSNVLGSWTSSNFKNENLIAYDPVPIPPPPPTIMPVRLSFSGQPLTINSGDSSELSWTSHYAVSCVGSNGTTQWTGDKPRIGTFNTGSLTQTTTFTITCSNGAGPVSKSVTVNVSSTPPTNPPPINPPPVTQCPVGNIYDRWQRYGSRSAYQQFEVVDSQNATPAGTKSQKIVSTSSGVGIRKTITGLDYSKRYKLTAKLKVTEGMASIKLSSNNPVTTNLTNQWIDLEDVIQGVTQANILITTAQNNTMFYVDDVKFEEYEDDPRQNSIAGRITNNCSPIYVGAIEVNGVIRYGDQSGGNFTVPSSVVSNGTHRIKLGRANAVGAPISEVYFDNNVQINDGDIILPSGNRVSAFALEYDVNHGFMREIMYTLKGNLTNAGSMVIGSYDSVVLSANSPYCSNLYGDITANASINGDYYELGIPRWAFVPGQFININYSAPGRSRIVRFNIPPASARPTVLNELSQSYWLVDTDNYYDDPYKIGFMNVDVTYGLRGKQLVTGTVMCQMTNVPIADARVQLTSLRSSPAGGLVDVITNANGEYSFDFDRPDYYRYNEQYKVEVYYGNNQYYRAQDLWDNGQKVWVFNGFFL